MIRSAIITFMYSELYVYKLLNFIWRYSAMNFFFIFILLPSLYHLYSPLRPIQFISTFPILLYSSPKYFFSWWFITRLDNNSTFYNLYPINFEYLNVNLFSMYISSGPSCVHYFQKINSLHVSSAFVFPLMFFPKSICIECLRD